MRKLWISAAAFCLAAYPLLAHKNVPHSQTDPARASLKKLKRINAQYVKNIKPIFQNKCFNCHAEAKRLPWYSKIPGPKHLIQSDIREAQKHLDMREDFPFKGHGTPLQDLEELEEVIQEDSMPPWYYRIMHWGAGLTPQEVERIQAWIDESRKLLSPEKE